MRRITTFMLAWALVSCGGDDGDAATDASTSGDTGGTDAGTTGDETSAGSTGETTSASTTGDTGGTAGTTGAEPPPGCESVTLPEIPSDPSLPGPFPVGAQTVDVDGLTVEVWYPATEVGEAPRVYDLRESLPESEAGKISDQDNPWQECDCYEGVPLDTGYGPYPVVLFIHGTAGFRSQSLEFMTHWASRGFVVLAADHPGLWLRDLIAQFCGGAPQQRDVQGDLQKMVGALNPPTGDLAFLAGAIDTSALAVVGHSAGGGELAGWGDQAKVLIPMAAGGTQAGSALVSTLVMGGTADTVSAYSGQQSGYESSSPRKRLVGLDNAGHLAFSSLCSLENAAGEDLVAVGQANDVCGLSLANFLFDCSDSYLPDPDGWEIIQYTTSAVLEETLHCRDHSAAFADLESRFPAVFEFKQEL